MEERAYDHDAMLDALLKLTEQALGDETRAADRFAARRILRVEVPRLVDHVRRLRAELEIHRPPPTPVDEWTRKASETLARSIAQAKMKRACPCCGGTRTVELGPRTLFQCRECNFEWR